MAEWQVEDLGEGESFDVTEDGRAGLYDVTLDEAERFVLDHQRRGDVVYLVHPDGYRERMTRWER